MVYVSGVMGFRFPVRLTICSYVLQINISELSWVLLLKVLICILPSWKLFYMQYRFINKIVSQWAIFRSESIEQVRWKFIYHTEPDVIFCIYFGFLASHRSSTFRKMILWRWKKTNKKMLHISMWFKGTISQTCLWYQININWVHYFDIAIDTGNWEIMDDADIRSKLDMWYIKCYHTSIEWNPANTTQWAD